MTKPITPQARQCLIESLELQRAIKEFLQSNQPSGLWGRDYRFQMDVNAGEPGQLASQIAAADFQACMLGQPRIKIFQR